MTFQDVVDKIGISNVFQNTAVDLATQNCILDWLFDYELCDDDETTWLRKFRRRCNDVYPKYLALVRVMTVKENMDPFIQLFMEKIHSTTDLKSTTLTIGDSGTSSQTDTREIVTDRDVAELDTRTSTDTYNNLQDSHNRGADGIKSETTYTNYRESTTGSSSGTNEDVTSGDPYAIAGSVTSNGESRGIAIAYPEANMGAIPNGVASDTAGATSDIAYASSEQRNFSKSTTGSQRSDQHLDQTVSTEYSDSNSSAKTITGSQAVTETGIDTNTRTGSVTTTKGGRLDTREDVTVTDELTRANTRNFTKTQTGSGNDSSRIEVAEQGRTESPADILPRAVRAITGSDEIQFLITGLMPCFDCFSRI